MSWDKLRRRLVSFRWGGMLVLAGLLSLVPFLLWRVWISQFPEGVPAYDWLFNAGGIRLRPAWWRWLFADRLAKIILGYWGVIPLGLGIVLKPMRKARWFFHWWLVGGFIYLVVFASGNVTHDYYQVVLMPVVAVFVAKGLKLLMLAPRSLISRWLSYGLSVAVCLFMLAFSWFHVRDFFNINHPEIVEAGEAADLLLPEDALVIASYGGDTAFLYQTQRRGWPIGGQIDEKVSRGATYYVSVDFNNETQSLIDRCRVLVKTDKHVIVDLEACYR